MKILTKEINYYLQCIQTDDPDLEHYNERHRHASEILKDYKLTKINPFEIDKDGDAESTLRSGAVAAARVMHQGLKDQDPTRPFQPFMLLEDDVSFYREMPDVINVPEGTDHLYCGNVSFGRTNGDTNTEIVADYHNEEMYRVYNMLGLHSVLICSPLGAASFYGALIDAFRSSISWDVIMAEMLYFYNSYCLVEPIFYQDEQYGGKSEFTKFGAMNLNLVPGKDHIYQFSNFFAESATKRIACMGQDVPKYF